MQFVLDFTVVVAVFLEKEKVALITFVFFSVFFFFEHIWVQFSKIIKTQNRTTTERQRKQNTEMR